VKADELIKLIRTTDDEHCKILLEGVFKFGFVHGMKKGYENIAMTMRKEVPISDSDYSHLVWSRNFL